MSRKENAKFNFLNMRKNKEKFYKRGGHGRSKVIKNKDNDSEEEVKNEIQDRIQKE